MGQNILMIILLIAHKTESHLSVKRLSKRGLSSDKVAPFSLMFRAPFQIKIIVRQHMQRYLAITNGVSDNLGEDGFGCGFGRGVGSGFRYSFRRGPGMTDG